MSADCIFCKIVAGTVPSTKVYEDSEIIAFMDIGPVVKGHTLVVPKKHCDPITGVPPELLQKLILVVQKIAKAHFAGLGAQGLHVTQANGKLAGQIVPHVHFHLIPRFESEGPQRNWVPGKYASNEEMSQYAKKIRDAIR